MTGAVVNDATSDNAAHTVLDRACLVLDAFDGPGQLTLAQVVARTGLPRSSAHRMLDRLVQLRWLRRQGRDYQLGMRLVELGSLAISQDRLHAAAVPFLHELRRATGHTVHLAVLDGPDVVYLEKIASQSAGAVPSRIGGRHPAHCSAVGKALLAFGAEAEVKASMAGLDLSHRRTRYSIADPAALNTELGKIRNHGVAYDREESVAGFGCVAAPIGKIGAAVAAVSVCGPIKQMQLDHSLAAPVRMSALGIWQGVDSNSVQPTLQRSRRPMQAGPPSTRAS